MGEVEGGSYPSDVSNEQCRFVLPYLLLSRLDSWSRQQEEGRSFSCDLLFFMFLNCVLL